MANALIFSASFEGHRQVYVFVLAQELYKQGYKVFIAGDYSTKLNNAFYLEKLNSYDDIIKLDTNGYKDAGLGISINEFVEIQNNYQIDLTIFAEGDNHIPLINSQILSHKNQFRGKTIGVFLRPFYFYQKLDFIDKLKYVKRLILTWKSDKRLFHEILNRQLCLLNKSLYIDDYFVSKHRNTYWLPDVFQQYADRYVIEEQSAQRHWIKLLEEFKNSNKDRTLLLYFGTSQKRRGYDKLLKLAVEHDACFVHCGLRDENDRAELQIEGYREKLKSKNMLFETDQYITDPICIEFFFRSVSHLILPYNNFYGSSGVMLQALSYNIPVLVPDIGIMGYRTRKYNLGLTYNDTLKPLDEQYKRFIETHSDVYGKSIEHYMTFQSVNQLEYVLSEIFSGSNKSVQLSLPS